MGGGGAERGRRMRSGGRPGASLASGSAVARSRAGHALRSNSLASRSLSGSPSLLRFSPWPNQHKSLAEKFLRSASETRHQSIHFMPSVISTFLKFQIDQGGVYPPGLAAKYLGVSRQALHRAAKAKKVQFQRVDGLSFYGFKSLRNFRDVRSAQANLRRYSVS